MTWVRAKTPKLMAGSGLLGVNNLQADQAELLNPRIQAVRGKKNNSEPGSPLPSNMNSPVQQHVVVFCNFSVLCFPLYVQLLRCRAVERPGM